MQASSAPIPASISWENFDLQPPTKPSPILLMQAAKAASQFATLYMRGSYQEAEDQAPIRQNPKGPEIAGLKPAEVADASQNALWTERYRPISSASVFSASLLFMRHLLTLKSRMLCFLALWLALGASTQYCMYISITLFLNWFCTQKLSMLMLWSESACLG